MIINYIVDPLQYYRRVDAYPLYENDRWQVAAFIHTFSFDTAIIGTSMTQNFSLRNVREKLGGTPLKLSIAGATIPEQILVVESAIKSGKVKRIIWGLDRHFFHEIKGPVEREMPVFLYERRFVAHIKYLLNLDMLSQSLRLVLKNFHMDFLQPPRQVLESYNSWWQEANFSKSAVLASYNEGLLKKKALAVYTGRSHVLRNFLTLLRSHPEVEFIIFFPPLSLAYFKQECALNPDGFNEDAKFRKEVLVNLSEFKNTKVFDFETDLEIISDLDNYKDLTHYSHKVNEYIVDSISKNSRLVTSADIAISQASFQNLPNQPFK
ncbi:MAG: hypothetical protein K2Y18_05880 [Alphaproteobacteria bacterium]|nr:hypothetical protein [Alphaproteobacteria bacterium]